MPMLLNPKNKEIFDLIIKKPEVQKYLTDIKLHHLDSYEHSVRVGQLVLDLGIENEIGGKDLETLCIAGLLHDLGKCDIQDELLSKDSSLTKEERESIKAHPRLGFIKIIEPKLEDVRKITVRHHEFKKCPYPRSGEDRRGDGRDISKERREKNDLLDLLSQVVAASDIFDALSNKRSYKEALPKEEVSRIMEGQFIGDKKFVYQVLKRY